jgi:APA family basic amino acid/polyamine antiporter
MARAAVPGPPTSFRKQLVSCKSIDKLIRESEEPENALKKSLGPWSLTALGIGAVIGSGIFTVIGTAMAGQKFDAPTISSTPLVHYLLTHTAMAGRPGAGPALAVSLVLVAVVCVFTGLCYAELASMIPIAGSAYTYTYATLGELVAWIIGWDLILEYALSASTIAVGWSGYFVSFLHDLGIVLPPTLTAARGAAAVAADGSAIQGVFNLPASVVVLLVTGLLIIGIKQSADANTGLVVLKVAVLIAFVGLGAAYVRPEHLTPLIPPNTGEFGHFGWSGVMRGAAVMFFAYIGFDAVSTAAQEARNPQRDMPIGILLSLAICTVLYIAVAIVLLGIVPYQKLNVADPLAVGIDATGLTWFSPVVKVSALFGLFSTMLVQLLGQTRIFYSMSRDGLLPKLFGAVHPRYGTPWLSTLLTGGVVTVAAGLLPIGVLGQLVSIGSLLAFVLVCIGVIVLRRTAPDVVRPFRCPGVPWVPVFGALACVAQMVSLPLKTWGRLVIWMALGLGIYFLYSRRRAREQRAVRGPGARAGTAIPIGG